MFNLVIAIDNQYGIGVQNKLPWYLPNDLINFKNLTTGGIVVMGRNTWESIPNYRRPLKNRVNVVLTTNPSSSTLGAHSIFSNLDDCISWLTIQKAPVFIIGGKMIYEQFLSRDLIKKVYLTIINKDFGCDVVLDKHIFKNFEKCELDDNGLKAKKKICESEQADYFELIKL